MKLCMLILILEEEPIGDSEAERIRPLWERRNHPIKEALTREAQLSPESSPDPNKEGDHQPRA